jgi:hypothetical protein
MRARIVVLAAVVAGGAWAQAATSAPAKPPEPSAKPPKQPKPPAKPPKRPKPPAKPPKLPKPPKRPPVVRSVPFTVKLTAKQTIEWRLPKHTTYTNCAGRFWEASRGTDTWEIATRGEPRIDITNYGDEDVRFTPPPAEDGTPRYFLPGGGHHVRHATLEDGLERSGACNADPPPRPKAPMDCGERLPDYEIDFHYIDGQLLWFAGTPRHSEQQGKTTFDTCPIEPPDGVTSTDFTTVRGTVRRAVVTGKRSFTVRGTKTFGPVVYDHERGGELHTYAKVVWKAEFTRVGR